MNAAFAGAQVIDRVAPPAIMRAAGDAAIRVAARIARRRARAQPDARAVRVLQLRPWFPLFRRWRRWRLGRPLSRRWCALAMLPSPPSSAGGVVCRRKRSPRPAGAGRWRDFPAAMTRPARRGKRVSTR